MEALETGELGLPTNPRDHTNGLTIGPNWVYKMEWVFHKRLGVYAPRLGGNPRNNSSPANK